MGVAGRFGEGARSAQGAGCASPAGDGARSGGVCGAGWRLQLCRDRRVDRDLPVGVRLRLGMGRCAPSKSTIRRILQALDAQPLDTVMSGRLADRVASSTASGQAGAVVKPSGARSPLPRAVAVDGKATPRSWRPCATSRSAATLT